MSTYSKHAPINGKSREPIISKVTSRAAQILSFFCFVLCGAFIVCRKEGRSYFWNQPIRKDPKVSTWQKLRESMLLFPLTIIVIKWFQQKALCQAVHSGWGMFGKHSWPSFYSLSYRLIPSQSRPHCVLLFPGRISDLCLLILRSVCCRASWKCLCITGQTIVSKFTWTTLFWY